MNLRVGAAVRDISPRKPMFLAGYPHAPRTSVGIHDALLASALFLTDGAVSLLLVAVDVLFISAESTEVCRRAIAEAVDVPAANILISATHTHSGPVTNVILAWREDAVVPPPDPEFMNQFHRGIIEAALAAHEAAEPARLAVTTAVAEGIGSNRIDPSGPFDSEVGLFALQRKRDGRLMAIDVIYGMHPTVLHEDSLLVSSDFLHFTRQSISEAFPGIVTLCQAGPCGNLSPRHHVTGQTLSEAERLGRKLGESIVRAVRGLEDRHFQDECVIGSRQRKVELPGNTFSSPDAAGRALRQAREHFDQLKRSGAAGALARTAECVIFGCEESLALARAQAAGEVAAWQKHYKFAEVQVFRIGGFLLAAWPGEFFVEYGLEVKSRSSRKTFVITLANGELQGYVVTPEAAATGGYEAAFALFKAESGKLMVEATLELTQELDA